MSIVIDDGNDDLGYVGRILVMIKIDISDNEMQCILFSTQIFDDYS